LIIKAVETCDKSLLEFVKGNGYSEGSIIDGMSEYLKTVFDTENDSKKCYIKYGINDISEDNVAYLIDVASGKILASEEGDSLFRMTETLKSKAISAGYEIIDKEQKL
jgi:hypothetical protein